MTTSWGYKKACMRCVWLFLAGTTLQLFLGDINNAFLHYPWGVILALFYAYLLILIYFLTDKYPALSKLYDHYACVAALASMIVMTVIFGLTRQSEDATGLLSALGVTRMTASWPFNLILLYFTSTLGLSVVDDMMHIKHRRIVPVLSHLCIFIILTAGIFGSGDKIRVQLTVPLDSPTHVGIVNGEPYELPFEVTLKKFEMEEYPPRLYLINMQSEKGSKDFLMIDGENAEKTFESWDIKVERYIANAMPDSVGFKEMNHVGTAPAAYIRAIHLSSKKEVKGWVSCGSFIFDPTYLQLEQMKVVSMSKPTPKHYLSDVQIMNLKGEEKPYAIEVNHPAKIGTWKIYQLGYDTERGKYSTISILECVHDAWYEVIHIALWLMLLSGILMFLTAGRRRKEKDK